MNINSDQQYQQFKRDYLALKGRGNLNDQDQRRFTDLQSAIGQWESSPNFHGDRVITDNNRVSGQQSNTGGGTTSART